MAFPVNARQWLFVFALLYVSILSCLPGEAYGDASEDELKEEHNPTQTEPTALSCFDDNNMYSRCEEPYRLDIQGSINVPPDYTDEYCNGPCLSETQRALDCVEHIFPDFEFYNKATIKDVRATLKAACGQGSDRGNFDVAEHIGSEESNAARANSVAFGIILLIVLRRVLFC
uniref:DUF7731 domain-containing protein n=1 Tax=Kalanchoe fedtschenkoi TaxID=63787 RepID=A0A7N0T760_KALFE